MSSSEEEGGIQSAIPQKRTRACDVCRKKKETGTVKEGLERVIRRLCPDDETYERWLCSLEEGSEEHILSPRHQVQPPTQVKPGALIDRISRAIRFVGTDSLTTLDDQIDSPVTAEDLSPTIDRFFGKSSGESLWERKPEVSYSARYTFPDPDLSTILIELFFQHINLYLPLLHRASFHKSVQDGLHRYDDDFAAVYLTSAGWKWYNQVESMKTTFLTSPTLYNLQFYCLSVIFLQSSSAPSSVWTMVGIAIRYDVDMPIDCDDEFLDHPDVEQRFKQPARKPSLTSAFILQIRLMQILIYCIRGIYSLSSTNWRLGLFGQKWKFHIVAELDSSLNKWLDSVPDHLRWDPDRQTDNFFNQSAMLYAIYYHVRILVHRSFIPLPGRPSPLTIPSLAICTNAARACCDVVYTLLQRNTLASLPALQVATLSSAIIMLFNIWLEKPPGLGISLDGNSDLESVHKCMQVLKAAEERWHMAGRFWDLLHELSSVRDPLPSTQTEQAGKLLVSTEQDGHGVPPQAEVVATELTDHGSPCDYRSSTHCLTEGGNATPRTHQSSTEPLQLRPFDYDCPPSSRTAPA
ncbi:hypothetical protein NLJ89_g887 [Agrocybe chaxingu]|uniref:Transcription factor domain-containing protein n=1 Tax=Agrocybe chaxingu TaxID=84603 RepID=A0A9W8TFC4_9AGAR|nr:hypothetical protein NLJ89_g887 [Agrocybe chaxingu]